MHIAKNAGNFGHNESHQQKKNSASHKKHNKRISKGGTNLVH